MKILAIILARKGSKRIRHKNKVILENKKLIEYTFALSKKINNFINVLLSTNDDEIIKIAKKYKILSTWKRPEHLCDHYSPSYKAAIHAYNWYKKYYSKVDGIFVLQPTSPFRSKTTIKKMISLFKTNNKRSIVCVSKCVEHPELMITLENNKLKPYLSKKYFTLPSQKFKMLYRINGLGYLLSPKTLQREKTLISKNSLCYINNSRVESIDIDDQEDLNLARKIKL
jgi:CMP-N,N'-diacetyllegionaminic acid synthase